MNERHRIKILLIIILFLGFSAGLYVGIAYYKINGKESGSEIMRMKGYKFISPLLDYETKPELKNMQIFILERTIKKFIEEKTRKGDAIYISVYFRDMFNGPWFGINQDEHFAPASLLKLPLMMAYLKYAEQDPKILSLMLKYDKNDIKNDTTQTILPDIQLKQGEYYSVEELIYRMIAYSDNAAKDMLLNNISDDILNKVHTDMGMIAPMPYVRNKTDLVTAKEYSSFFRVLFNASYLNKEMSEKALEILSKSTFKVGIVAGVPKNVTVAHKFAETKDTASQALQLHDCGIVYYKNRPYLLCVMTYGKDFKALLEIIEDVSSIIYKNVDNYYKNSK